MDTLRIERTKYSQEEFAKRCGIPLRTYARWVSGESKVRFTARQIKAVCRELQIVKVEDIPDDLDQKPSTQKPSKKQKK